MCVPVILSDPQWALVSPILCPPPRVGPGRRPQDLRPVLQAILWILDQGAKWKALPSQPGVYAPRSSAHRWLQRWSRDGTLRRVLEALGAQAREAGKLKFHEGFIDGTFAAAKKGARASAKPRRARAPRS
jgi:transposase